MAAPQSMSKPAAETIRGDADFIVQKLPTDDSEFLFRAVTDHEQDWVEHKFRRLTRTGVIKSVGRYNSPEESAPLKTYRIPAAHREFAKEIVAGRNAPLPCGHAGLQNCGDHFECSYRGCSKEFDREEVDFE